jgi:hypothetical protein
MSKFRKIQISGYTQNLKYVKIFHYRFLPHNFKLIWRHIKFSPVLLIAFTVQGTLSNEPERWYVFVNWNNIWEELYTSRLMYALLILILWLPVDTFAHLLRKQNYWLKASRIKNKPSRLINYENNQQDALYRLICYSRSA